jgi:peptidylprolyl isomerase
VHSSRIKALVVIGVSASLLTLAACGKDDPNASASASPSAAASPSESAAPSESPSASPTPSAKPIKASNNFDDVAVTGAYGKSPKVKVKSPWGIDETRTKVLEPSKGPVIAAGSTVEVDYYGVDGRTGKKFDESFSRAPVSFPLDQVVPGFSKGLTGQRQGSRVLIAMPGKDGYDSSGGNAQAGINVGDTLIFVVDIVSVPLTGPEGKKVTPKDGLPTVTDKGGVPEISVPKTDPPAELQVQPLIKGTGKAVGQSDTITFNYRYVTWADGKTVESSYESKAGAAPLTSLLPGMVKGLTGQTVGSRVLLVIPPADAYPDGNAKPSVAPNQTLVMVVDLLFTASSG